MGIIVQNNGSIGPESMEMTITDDMDDGPPFIAISLEDPNLNPVLDVYIEDPDDADEFLAQATVAVRGLRERRKVYTRQRL